MSQQNSSELDLGFAESFPSEWMSKSKFFPSKCGGWPSFLILDPILGYEQLACSKCKRTMRFLLQLYAPIESIDEAFHRHLFIFVCGQTEQCANEVRLFRCQLPRKNNFYSEDPPDYEQDSEEYDPNPTKFGNSLCEICGIKAPKHCSNCLKTYYCSKEHQIIHWKKGGHKEICKKEDSNLTDNQFDLSKYENIVFPELEIVIDYDNNNDEQETSDDKEIEMKKYQEYLDKYKPILQNENMDEYLENKDEELKIFNRFKKMAFRGEIIRYCAGWQENCDTNQSDKILWISNKNKILDFAEEVPACENCGTSRRFEFQIMPNLLNKIQLNSKIDSLDFGTLLVFSCPQSCTKNEPDKTNPLDYYMPEYIYNQKV